MEICVSLRAKNQLNQSQLVSTIPEDTVGEALEGNTSPDSN